MAMDENVVDLIRNLVERMKMTHLQVAEHIRANLGLARGYSERTVRKICHDHLIKCVGEAVPDEALSGAVQAAIGKV